MFSNLKSFAQLKITSILLMNYSSIFLNKNYFPSCIFLDNIAQACKIAPGI